MKNQLLTIATIAVLASLSVGIYSCKDDEPPAKPVISFEHAQYAAAESEGVVSIKIELDRPAPEDITIEYDLGGSAVNLIDAPNAAAADYNIVGSGEIEVEKGESEATIEITLYDDILAEETEIITLELDEVGSNATISEEDNMTQVSISDADPKLKANITTSPYTISESDNIEGNSLKTFEVAVGLSAPAPIDMTIKYQLSGTAYDSMLIWENDASPFLVDYFIDAPNFGELTIKNGESTGKIKFKVLHDVLYEPQGETIIITLVSGGSIAVEPGVDNQVTLTLAQGDGKMVELNWDKPEYTDVDMDLFMYFGADVDNLDFFFGISNNPGTTPKYERLFIPSNFFVEGSDVGMGCSYIYYGGSSNNLNFTVQFADYVDGTLEPVESRDVFTATYGTVNRNKYDDEQTGTWPPAIVQTFTAVDNVIGNFSQITVPATGSRQRTPAVPLNGLNLQKYKRGGFSRPN